MKTAPKKRKPPRPRTNAELVRDVIRQGMANARALDQASLRLKSMGEMLSKLQAERNALWEENLKHRAARTRFRELVGELSAQACVIPMGVAGVP